MPPRKASMTDLVKKLSQKIEQFDGVTTKKNQKKIAFAHNFPFASITIKKDKLELEFITPSQIKHARMESVKQIKTDKFSHKISITKEIDINPQVTGWLLIAHATN